MGGVVPLFAHQAPPEFRDAVAGGVGFVELSRFHV